MTATDNGWRPPPLDELTDQWTVPPWITRRYERWVAHPSFLQRAAALGLVYDHFLPEGVDERRAFLRKTRRDTNDLPNDRAYAIAKAMPMRARRRLAREAVHEVRLLRKTLDEIEARGFEEIEVLTLLFRREQVELALLPLIAGHHAFRVRCAAKSFDDAASRRLARCARIPTLDPLLLSLRRRFVKRWWAK